MNSQILKELTTKYTHKEIATAVKLLGDVLKMPQKIQKSSIKSKEPFKSINIQEEFSAQEIARLKKQKRNRISSKTQYVSAKKVWHDLGI